MKGLLLCSTLALSTVFIAEMAVFYSIDAMIYCEPETWIKRGKKILKASVTVAFSLLLQRLCLEIDLES